MTLLELLNLVTWLWYLSLIVAAVHYAFVVPPIVRAWLARIDYDNAGARHRAAPDR